MKKFMLPVVSALALGMVGVGFAQAAGTSSTTTMPPYNSSASTTQTPSTMQQGSESQTAPVNVSENQIKQVQEHLKTAGLYNGKADGKMGPETKQALQQFQQQQGLQATGQLDQETMAALQSNQGNAGSTASPNGSSPNAGGLNNNLNNNQH